MNILKILNFTVRDIKFRIFEMIPTLRNRPSQTTEALDLDLHEGRWY